MTTLTFTADDGETTEEDLPKDALYIGPRNSVLRRPSTDSGSEEEITVARRSSFRGQKGPPLGSWVRDRTKAYVLMDTNAKKLIMFKAEITPRRWSMDADNARQNLSDFNLGQDSLEDTPGAELSPMISNSGNLMLSAMNGGLGGNGARPFGPPEAFFPFTDINPNGSILQDSVDSYDDDTVDEDELLFAVEDFLDFGESADEEDTTAEDSAAPSSTPARPSTSQDMHHHLPKPHLVGAFRNNQDRHQLLSRNKASKASLAFGGPLNQGPIRGIKDNRLAAANTPITPVRKRKTPKASMPSSPFSQSPLKRKASGGAEMANSHKRSKSMV